MVGNDDDLDDSMMCNQTRRKQQIVEFDNGERTVTTTF